MHDKTVVIFDDCWNMEGSGCNRIICSMGRSEFLVEILQSTDKFKKDWDILHINFIEVMKRTKTKEKL